MEAALIPKEQLDELMDRVARRIVRMTAPVMWSRSDIAEYMGYSSKTSVDKLTAQPTFPKALRFGSPVWDSKEVKEWVQRNKERH